MASAIVYIFELDIRVYLVLVAGSTVVSYYARDRFLRAPGHDLRIDRVALLALALSIPIAYLDSFPLSLACSLSIAIHIFFRVCKADPAH